MPPPPEHGVSEAGMRIVRLLVGKRPQSVAELIRATGVTRTAVTEQLNELLAAGFVERSTEAPAGRGRPRHLYSTTTECLLKLFASNQCLLVPAIWEAVAEICGDDMKRKVLRRVGRKLANHYKPRVTGKTARERLFQVAELLGEEGCEVDVEDDGEGTIVLHKRSCPFISMFEESQSVCCVDQEMLRRVLRAPVRRTTYRHEGDYCCSFAVKLNGKRP